MTEPTALRELRELLAAFLDRPLGSAIVVGCRDADMLLFIHAVDALDLASPADRFLLFCDPFVDPRSYVDSLVDCVSRATGRPAPPHSGPEDRLRAVIADLLAALPPGDHRLLVALAPIRIHDPDSFTALVTPLLVDPAPAALRLVVRDDLAAPRHFVAAAASPSAALLAHEFHVPVAALLDDVVATARDPNQRPDTRAQALLQLGLHAASHGHRDDAVTACEAAVALAESPQVLALALAFHADALLTRGDLEPAQASAQLALDEALACSAAPVVDHTAMSLGAVSWRLGDRELAAACFALVERITANPANRTLARDQRLALAAETPC